MLLDINPEQVRAKSEKYLASKGLSVNPHLPTLEDPSTLQPPSAKDIARRAFVLSHIIGLAYDIKPAQLKKSLEKWSLWPYVTPSEARLLSGNTVSKQERINASWLPDAVQSLAWSLSLVPLNHWQGCNENLASFFEPYADPTARIDAASARPFKDIYSEADLIYRLHWSVKHAPKASANPSLSLSAITERHRALNWLWGVEQDWDEVTTDT